MSATVTEQARACTLRRTQKQLNGAARWALDAAAQRLATDRLMRRFEYGGAAQAVGYTANARYRRWKFLRFKQAIPMVLTGQLRFSAWRGLEVRTVATKGQARTRLTYGRLGVGRRGAFVAVPPMVRATMTAIGSVDQEQTSAWFRAHLRTLLDQDDPQPLSQAAWVSAKAAGITRAAAEVARLVSETPQRLAAAQEARQRRHQRWSQRAGGSAPLDAQQHQPSTPIHVRWRSASRTYRRTAAGKATRARWARTHRQSTPRA